MAWVAAQGRTPAAFWEIYVAGGVEPRSGQLARELNRPITRQAAQS